MWIPICPFLTFIQCHHFHKYPRIRVPLAELLIYSIRFCLSLLEYHTVVIIIVGGKISFYLSRFFGSSNDQINVRQMDRKKTNLITYVQGPHKDKETQRTSWAFEAYMLSWAKEWDGAWDFKGEKSNSQDDKKSRCLVSRCSAIQIDHPHKKLFQVVALFLDKAPCLNSFRWLRER